MSKKFEIVGDIGACYVLGMHDPDCLYQRLIVAQVSALYKILQYFGVLC